MVNKNKALCIQIYAMNYEILNTFVAIKDVNKINKKIGELNHFFPD
jgi:hypothetical protein